MDENVESETGPSEAKTEELVSLPPDRSENKAEEKNENIISNKATEMAETEQTNEDLVPVTSPDNKNTEKDVDNDVSEEANAKEIGAQGEGVESSSPTEEPKSKNAKLSETPQIAEPMAFVPMPSAAPVRKDSFYHIKWITFRGEKTAIVTQNENGPCPLLAIFNVLLLHHKVQLPEALTVISSSKMMDHIGEVIWDMIPQNLSEVEQTNYEQNISDAVSIFPKLQTGLDVNISFCSVNSFEYTPELTVFDLLRIPLYHGWVIDPQDTQSMKAIGGCSYNQLVEKVINSKSCDDNTLINEGLIAEEFLNSTASQLTWYGISSLCETLSSGNLAVLFRNNHFSTIHRNKDELFTLVTDCGFLREPNVVWETLSSIQGDSYFVDSSFHTAPLKTEDQNIATCPTNLDTAEQIDYDYQVALSLQQDQVPGPSAGASVSPSHIAPNEESDHQLAQRLYDEEVERANAAAIQAEQQADIHRSQDPNSSDRPHSANPGSPGSNPNSSRRNRPSSAPNKESCSFL